MLLLSNGSVFYLVGHGIQGLLRFPSSHWLPESSEPNESLLSQTSKIQHMVSVCSPHSRLHLSALPEFFLRVFTWISPPCKLL